MNLNIHKKKKKNYKITGGELATKILVEKVYQAWPFNCINPP